MAETTKKYLDYAGLSLYDEKIKKVINDGLDTKEATGVAATLVNALKDGQVATNKDAIDAINNTTTGILATAKGYTDTEVGKVNAAIGTVPTDSTVMAEIAKAQTAATYDDSALAGRVSQTENDILAINNNTTGILATAKAYTDTQVGAHQTAIDSKLTTLIGSDADKSVRTIANEELAAQLIPASAAESLDTLQEIAAWIQAHPGDAAEMNGKISALETKVGDKTVSARIADEAAGATYKAAAEGQEKVTVAQAIAALETAVGGENGGVAQQIKAAVEALDATASQTAGTDGLALSITEVDGKITAISGSIAANTYDAHGAAKAVQGETTATVKDVEDKVNAFTAITTSEINALFVETPSQS